MSKKRQSQDRLTKSARDPEAGLLMRTYAVTHPANVGIATRSFGRWDQLTYAVEGVMNVDTEAGTWVVPGYRAVWIPAGVEHRVRMTGRVRVRTIFLRPAMTRRQMPRECCAVNVPALLRELIVEATRIGVLRRDRPPEARLARVIVDRLGVLPHAGLALPMPVESRAQRAAALIVKAPGDPDILGRAAKEAGATRRTLERLFVTQTHMTLGRWRRRARMIEAMRHLARGEAVNTVSSSLGYSSPSAFVVAFRHELGTTPGRYFARDVEELRPSSDGPEPT